MTDFTPFEQLLAGHAGVPEDSLHDRWLRAQELFASRAYRDAALLLRDLVAEADANDEIGHELTDVRLLLARALFHSAQLDGTIEVATDLLARDPSEAYAHLLLARALERKGRRDEAAPHARLASVLGDYRA